jgi:hypothetical protein
MNPFDSDFLIDFYEFAEKQLFSHKRLLVAYSFSSLLTNGSNKLGCYITPASDKHSTLLGSFLSYEENEV